MGRITAALRVTGSLSDHNDERDDEDDDQWLEFRLSVEEIAGHFPGLSIEVDAA